MTCSRCELNLKIFLPLPKIENIVTLYDIYHKIATHKISKMNPKGTAYEIVYIHTGGGSKEGAGKVGKYIQVKTHLLEAFKPMQCSKIFI